MDNVFIYETVQFNLCPNYCQKRMKEVCLFRKIVATTHQTENVPNFLFLFVRYA